MKSDKNIVVIGANGMLGTYVTKYFQRNGWKVTPITRETMNINLETLYETMDALKWDDSRHENDIIINCAGIIPQRKNTNVLEMTLVNSVFPHVLQEVCEKAGAKLIHISTDCVFSGEIGWYNEESPTNAPTLYGKSKSLGEPKNACIIRTSIIGEEINNKLGLLEWAKSNKGNEIFGWVNSVWNGVTCLQLAKYIESIILNNGLWTGVHHYMTVNKIEKINPFSFEDRPVLRPISVNKMDLLNYINTIYDLNMNVRYQIGPKDDKTLTSYFLVETPTIEQQIQEMKDFNIYE